MRKQSPPKKRTKLIVVWNCGLSMPDVGKPWRWKSHVKEMSWSLESFLIWEHGNKWFTSSCTPSFPVFHSSRRWNRFSLLRYPICVCASTASLFPLLVHLFNDCHSCFRGSRCSREIQELRICFLQWSEETDWSAVGVLKEEKPLLKTVQEIIMCSRLQDEKKRLPW